ncbi:hypothetical protein FHG87_002651 [Trinorchestia longiramus]|nr:hypothetical protein FHG87_002651 [Trinorchestia longiramus]
MLQSNTRASQLGGWGRAAVVVATEAAIDNGRDNGMGNGMGNGGGNGGLKERGNKDCNERCNGGGNRGSNGGGNRGSNGGGNRGSNGGGNRGSNGGGNGGSNGGGDGGTIKNSPASQVLQKLLTYAIRSPRSSTPQRWQLRCCHHNYRQARELLGMLLLPLQTSEGAIKDAAITAADKRGSSLGCCRHN